MKIISTGSEKNTSSPPLDPSHVPLLLFDYDKPGEATAVKLFYSVPAGKLHVKRVADLRDHYYWKTPQGWMLLVHPGTRDTFLWNPLTHARVALPPEREALEEIEDEARCLLSHGPGHPDCVVLIADLENTVLWHCRPGGDRWRRHEYGHQLEAAFSDVDADVSLLHGMSMLTTVGGRFYTVHAINRQFIVAAIELSPAGPKFTVVAANDREEKPAGLSISGFSAVESDGELFVVAWYYMKYRDRMASKIMVLKLDLSKREEVKVMSTLGERAFFLDVSPGFGVSLPAKQFGLKENCIYFLKAYDKGLYVYDLGRGTTTMHNPGQDLDDDVTPRLLAPLW